MSNFKEVKLCFVANNIEAEMIMEALKNNDIPAIKKGVGSSDIMNVYGGFSLFGEEIFVGDQNLEKAEEILREMGFEE